MSNEILTANIVMSSDYTLLTSIINGEIPLNDAEKAHTLILSNDNSNFVSLTHSMNFSQNSEGAKAPQIQLELVDPEGKFNERFIFASLNSLIYGKSVTSRDSALNNTSYDELKHLQDRAEQNGDFGYLKAFYPTNPNGGDQRPGYPQELPSLPLHAVTPVTPSDFLELTNLDWVNMLIPTNSAKAIYDVYIKGKELQNREKKSEEYQKQVDILKEANSSLKTKVEEQLQAIKNRMSNPNVYIIYGVGSNMKYWAGPFICRMQGVDYKFNGSTGAKSILLTFVPMGDITIFTGDNILKNGIGLLGTRDSLPVKISIFKDQTSKYDFTRDTEYRQSLNNAKLKRLLGNTAGVNEKDVDKVLNTLVYNYIKNAVTDTDVVVILPDMNKVVNKQIDFLKTAMEKYLNNNYWSPFALGKGPLIEAYTYIELYRSLGLQITMNGSFATDKFIGNPHPEVFIEDFDAYLGRNKYTDIAVSLIKYPNQTYKEPLDNLAKELANNGRPIDFEMEVVHDVNYIRKLASYLKSRGDNRVSGTRPVMVVGDRGLIERFLFGKQNLVDKGVIKYVNNDVDPSSVKSLDYYLTDSNKIFSTPEYLNIASSCFLSYKPEYPYEFSQLPKDSFFFLDPKVSESNLNGAGVSIFTLGIENSNILDINTNVNLSYYLALQQIWFSEVKKGRVHSGSKDVEAEGVSSPNYANKRSVQTALTAVTTTSPDTIKQKMEIYRKDLNEMGFNDQTLEDITAYLINLLGTNKEGRGFTIPVDWSTGDDAFQQLIRMLININRQANQATIKTLPAFHLSKGNMCQPTVLLILNEPGMVGKSNAYSILKVMGGFWRVIGFEHKISGYDISSSFQLVKDLSAGLPILNTIQTIDSKLQ